jgi:hypothetical protein
LNNTKDEKKIESNKNIRILRNNDKMTTNNNQGVEKAHYKTKGTRLDLIFFFSNNKRLKALDMMLKGITNT